MLYYMCATWGILSVWLWTLFSLSGLILVYYGCTFGVLSKGGVLEILSKQGVLAVPFETKLCY